MPIINQWDDEAETIIYGEFSGKWTWDEFFETINKSSEMIGTKPYRCDVIANMRPGTMESAAPALYNAREAMRMVPENFGLLVVVINPLIGMLANVFKRFDAQLGSKVVSVSSVEQARELIAKERANASK